ncbi:microtubule-associated protein [Anaeramoeba flamelloides]|uniref:Microtubule-associated protein n=1 Tax=Anaeramoeba flamelloides TaxID=1746091 RepID=A0AAV7YWQ8_9EUKA|nr:microtubule-associated protein [Anaeramoeba flamelloides]
MSKLRTIFQRKKKHQTSTQTDTIINQNKEKNNLKKEKNLDELNLEELLQIEELNSNESIRLLVLTQFDSLYEKESETLKKYSANQKLFNIFTDYFLELCKAFFEEEEKEKGQEKEEEQEEKQFFCFQRNLFLKDQNYEYVVIKLIKSLNYFSIDTRNTNNFIKKDFPILTIKMLLLLETIENKYQKRKKKKEKLEKEEKKREEKEKEKDKEKEKEKEKEKSEKKEKKKEEEEILFQIKTLMNNLLCNFFELKLIFLYLVNNNRLNDLFLHPTSLFCNSISTLLNTPFSEMVLGKIKDNSIIKKIVNKIEQEDQLNIIFNYFKTFSVLFKILNQNSNGCSVLSENENEQLAIFQVIEKKIKTVLNVKTKLNGEQFHKIKNLLIDILICSNFEINGKIHFITPISTYFEIVFHLLEKGKIGNVKEYIKIFETIIVKNESNCKILINEKKIINHIFKKLHSTNSLLRKEIFDIIIQIVLNCKSKGETEYIINLLINRYLDLNSFNELMFIHVKGFQKLIQNNKEIKNLISKTSFLETILERIKTITKISSSNSNSISKNNNTNKINERAFKLFKLDMECLTALLNNSNNNLRKFKEKNGINYLLQLITNPFFANNCFDVIEIIFNQKTELNLLDDFEKLINFFLNYNEGDLWFVNTYLTTMTNIFKNKFLNMQIIHYWVKENLILIFFQKILINLFNKIINNNNNNKEKIQLNLIDNLFEMLNNLIKNFKLIKNYFKNNYLKFLKILLESNLSKTNNGELLFSLLFNLSIENGKKIKNFSIIKIIFNLYLNHIDSIQNEIIILNNFYLLIKNNKYNRKKLNKLNFCQIIMNKYFNLFINYPVNECTNDNKNKNDKNDNKNLNDKNDNDNKNNKNKKYK